MPDSTWPGEQWARTPGHKSLARPARVSRSPRCSWTTSSRICFWEYQELADGSFCWQSGLLSTWWVASLCVSSPCRAETCRRTRTRQADTCQSSGSSPRPLRRTRAHAAVRLCRVSNTAQRWKSKTCSTIWSTLSLWPRRALSSLPSWATARCPTNSSTLGWRAKVWSHDARIDRPCVWTWRRSLAWRAICPSATLQTHTHNKGNTSRQHHTITTSNSLQQQLICILTSASLTHHRFDLFQYVYILALALSLPQYVPEQLAGILNRAWRMIHIDTHLSWQRLTKTRDFELIFVVVVVLGTGRLCPCLSSVRRGQQVASLDSSRSLFCACVCRVCVWETMRKESEDTKLVCHFGWTVTSKLFCAGQEKIQVNTT